MYIIKSSYYYSYKRAIILSARNHSPLGMCGSHLLFSSLTMSSDHRVGLVVWLQKEIFRTLCPTVTNAAAEI